MNQPIFTQIFIIILPLLVIYHQNAGNAYLSVLHILCGRALIGSLFPFIRVNLSYVGYIVFKSDLGSFLYMKTPIRVIHNPFYLLQWEEITITQYIVISI